MKMIRWAAVAVTTLFVLMNLGAAVDGDQSDGVRLTSGVLAVLGIPAAVGLARRLVWGRFAAIGVGLLNIAAGVGAVVADKEGGAIGIVVGGLGALLADLSDRSDEPVTASVRGESRSIR